MNPLSRKEQQQRKIRTQPGFLAALDQSGGSTPKALAAYGLKENAWSNEDEITDVMSGDATLFSREDYVEVAWRIVDSAIKAGAPVFEYELNTWGPAEVEQIVVPQGGWHNPVVNNGQPAK